MLIRIKKELRTLWPFIGLEFFFLICWAFLFYIMVNRIENNWLDRDFMFAASEILSLWYSILWGLIIITTMCATVYLFSSEISANTIIRILSQPIHRRSLWFEKITPMLILSLIIVVLLTLVGPIAEPIVLSISYNKSAKALETWTEEQIQQSMADFQDRRTMMGYSKDYKFTKSDVLALHYNPLSQMQNPILPPQRVIFYFLITIPFWIILILSSCILASLYLKKAATAFFGAIIWITIPNSIFFTIGSTFSKSIDSIAIIHGCCMVLFAVTTYLIAYKKFLRLEL